MLVLDSGNNALKRIIQLDNIATSVVEKSDLVFDKGLIIIFSSVAFVLFAAIVTFFIKQSSSFRSKHSTKLTNIERLQTIGARVNVDNSVTVNVTKSGK